MDYLYNGWYVAAWAEEIGEQMLVRTLLDIPIVLFRDGERVIAMHDRCPHRFAPLSRGALIDGTVRCGYHGLSFDTSGRCIGSLFSKAAPQAARVRTFVTHERDRAVWIWMGDNPAADPTKIPSLEFHHDPEMRCQYGYTHTKANYLLVSDNLMDLTHTALLHPLFGGLDYLPAYKWWKDGEDIISQYIVEHMPSFLQPGSGKTLRNEDKIRWIAPANHYLESRVTPDGEDRCIFIPAAHLLTPETATTTHYFWSAATPPGFSDADARAVLEQAFDLEDKPMIEAVQDRMGAADLWDLDPVLVNTDTGSVQVRRRLQELIKLERAARSPATPSAGAARAS